MTDFIPVGNNGIHGKLSLAKDPNAPLILCFGGIDVASKRSGIYMYDYFNDKFMEKYHLFVAYSHQTNGPLAKQAVDKILESRKIKPSYTLLYLFSGGHGPGKKVLSELAQVEASLGSAPVSGLSFFKKVILVDIYLGKSLEFVNLSTSSPEKFVYFWTSGGHANADSNKKIRDAVEDYEVKTGHMLTNVEAVKWLEKTYQPPWTTSNTAPTQTMTTSKVTSLIAAVGDYKINIIAKEYSDIVPIQEASGDKITTADSLKTALSTLNPISSVKKLLVSIGEGDSWNLSVSSGLVNNPVGNKLVTDMIAKLRITFPNAELYILNGTWGYNKIIKNPRAILVDKFTLKSRLEYSDSGNGLVTSGEIDFFADSILANSKSYAVTTDKSKAEIQLKEFEEFEIRALDIRQYIYNEKTNKTYELKTKKPVYDGSGVSDATGKLIDAYVSFFVGNQFKVIGKNEKSTQSPEQSPTWAKSLRDDLIKNGFLPGATQSQTTGATSSTPQGQETSKGDLNPSGSEESKKSKFKNNLKTNGIENIFKTTIKPSQIEIPAPLPEEAKKEFVRGMGYLPIIWYNKMQIDMENVISFSLTYEDILPTLKLVFYDSLGIIKDTATPADNTKITIFISSRSDKLKPVYTQFKITNFQNRERMLTITGALDVDGLYLKQYKSFKGMSSNELLQVICKEIGLGFNTNIVETNDEMNWINTGSRNWEFMSEVVENSYISDEAFISASVDIYYNFNFVDIQKELSRDTSSDRSVSTNGLRDILGLPQTEETGPMILTSDNSLSGTNHYFSTWKILNRATDTAIERGYSDDFVYYNADTKKTENFDVHSMTLNEGESMVLKGGKNDGAFFANNKNYVYAGKASNDNSHTNYNYSQTHNNRNISEAEKMAAELELPFPNYNIYKFQKIRVLFSHNVTTLSSPAFNSRYSGEWMVVDVKYVFYDGVFKQIISIIKREMSLTQEEIDSGFPNKPRPEGRGENKNPTPITYPNTDASGATASVNPLLRAPETVTINTNFNTSPVVGATVSGNINNNVDIGPPDRESRLFTATTVPKRVSKQIQQNMAAVERALRAINITTPVLIRAVMGNIWKECGGIPIRENLRYCKTSNERLRRIFTSRLQKFSEAELNVIKCNEQRLAEVIYGVQSGATGNNLGNDSPGDGYKYLGRGFIGITGKAIYRNVSRGVYGDDRLVTNPDMLLEVEASAKAAAYFINLGLGSMARRLGFNLNTLTQDQANLLVTSVIAGQPIRRGGNNILNDLVVKVDNFVNTNFA
jgi:predicted chitinase